MISTVLFLSTLTEIDELLVVVGRESSVALICDICRMSKVKKLTLCYLSHEQMEDFSGELNWFKLSEKQFFPEDFNEIIIHELTSFKSESSHFAVFFDCIHDLGTITSFSALMPQYLLGTIDRREINPFAIWECYRTIVTHIYILSYEPNQKDEVLNWWKRPETNVELSVIFPVYNVAPYIKKCIQSVIQWPADYVEYIFVDDGSPDNSAEIIAKYVKQDERIKLFHKENGGCASARQYGMERSSGKYIGFVDPDDYIDPTMFQKLFMRALSGSFDIAYCGYNELYENTGSIHAVDDVLGWPYYEGTCDRHSINELIAYRRIAIWRAIYSKELITKNNIHFYEDLRRFDDLPFKVETLAKANSVVCIPEYLYYYRMLRPGQDVSADDERLYVHFSIFHYLDTFIRNTGDKEQLRYLQVVKIQTHQWALERIKPQFVSEYIKLAQKDLLSNMSAHESIQLASKYTSFRNQQFNIAICSGQLWAVKALLNKKEKKNQRKELKIQRIHEMAEKRYS